MKYLLLILLPLLSHAGYMYPDRWITLTEAQAWACPASESLVKTSDDCQIADPGQCVYVPVAPCTSIVLKTPSLSGSPTEPLTIDYYTFEVAKSHFFADVNGATITSGDFRKIPHTIDWGTNGQVLTTDGTKAEWVTAASASGDVVGPASAVDNNFAAFDSTTGKLIKDSGISATNAVISNLAGTRMVSCSFDSAGNKMDDTSLCGWIVISNRPETGRWNYAMNGWAGTPTCVISSYYDGDRWCGGDPKGGAWTTTRIAANCFEDSTGTARRDINHKIICHGRAL